jgi:hypothetical protein
MLEQITALMIAAKNDFEIRRAEALYDLYVQEQERTAPKPKGLTINELLNKVSDGVINALPVLMPLLQQLSAISQMQQSEQNCSDCVQSHKYLKILEVAKSDAFKNWFIEILPGESMSSAEANDLYNKLFDANNVQSLIDVVRDYELLVNTGAIKNEEPPTETCGEETHFEVPLPPVVSSDGKTFIPKKRKTETTTI